MIDLCTCKEAVSRDNSTSSSCASPATATKQVHDKTQQEPQIDLLQISSQKPQKSVFYRKLQGENDIIQVQEEDEDEDIESLVNSHPEASQDGQQKLEGTSPRTTDRTTKAEGNYPDNNRSEQNCDRSEKPLESATERDNSDSIVGRVTLTSTVNSIPCQCSEQRNTTRTNGVYMQVPQTDASSKDESLNPLYDAASAQCDNNVTRTKQKTQLTDNQHARNSHADADDSVFHDNAGASAAQAIPRMSRFNPFDGNTTVPKSSPEMRSFLHSKFNSQPHRYDCDWRPVVILIPVRLGGLDFNPVYSTCLKKVLQNPYTLGIIGGKPKHSLFFVGWQGN